MDTQVSPLPVDQSSENDEDPSLKIDDPEIGEEEEQFFDAGENAHNLSDTTPTDLNFSVANEDLPTDDSDHSEQNSPTAAPRSKRRVEPIIDNLDDISTEGPSSVDGNNSPRTGEALFDDDNEVPGGSKPAFSSESERNEDAVSQPPINNAVYQCSTDNFSQNKAEKSSEDVPSQEDDVNVNNISKSSIEVMDDESDSLSSKRSSPVEVAPSSDAPNENSNADVVEASVENSTENGSEMISENNAPLDSASTEKDEKVPETNEILSMDDSDFDESLQENLDVAIKVVEESQSSPVHTSTAEEHETFAKTDDCTNNDDLLKDTTSKSENILEEFQEDAAKINGDSSELLDRRLCSCQVVLFRIEFDEYALKYLKKKTETTPSSSDHNTDSSMDTSLSKAPDSDSNSESSFSNTPTKLSPPKRRVLTKAARKMIPPPESNKKTSHPRARNSRASTNSESTRPRRQVRNATEQSSKYVHSKSSSSDDEAPLTRPSGKRKAVVNSTKRSARTVKKPSYPQRTSSRRSIRKEVGNFENELFINLSGEKTLKCVSIPIITDLIDSLKEKSCSELIAIIEQKEDKLPSQITKSKTRRNTTVERSSRRRKLSPSDTSKSSVEDDDYKTYGKMWRCDDGTSREENNFSLRSEAKSTSSKRCSRKSAEVRNYVEDSGCEDEIPLKKAKTRSRGNLTRVKRREKKDTSSDDEKAEDSPKAKSTSTRKSPRQSAKVRNHVEDCESDEESPLKKKNSRRNLTQLERSERNDTDDDDEKAEDLPKAKLASNRRSPRKSAEVQKYVEDSEPNDESPLMKERTNRENLTPDTNSDDEKAEDSSKAKTTSSRRSLRKSAKVLKYVEDTISDDESPLRKENTSREKSTHVEHNEKNDTDSDDEKVEVSSKGKSTSNKRSSRQSTKVLNYFEDSESDDVSPLKKEMTSGESSTHVTDSDDEKTENSSKAKSTSNKRSAMKSAEVLNYVEDFKSDDESLSQKERISRKNSTNAERNEKNYTDIHDEEAESLPKAKSTSNKRSSRQSTKVPKYVEDSESDDESQLKKERTSRKNSVHVTDSDDERAEDSPKVKSTSNKRSSKTTAKAPNYRDDSDSDEFPLKEPTSEENSTHLVENEKNDTDSDDGSVEDSSSETDNQSSRSRKGLSSSRTRTRA